MYSKIKKLGSETLIYGFATVFGRFLNFLLTPLYSNLLFGTEYEFVIYIYSLLAFINVVYSFGMESAFFRFYAHDNIEQSKKVFTQSFFMINIISLITTLLILFSSEKIAFVIAPELETASYLIRIAAFIPFFDALILIPMGLMRMTNQAKKFAAIRFSLIFITVVLNLIFLNIMGMQAEGVIYAQLIASFIGFAYLIQMIYKNFLNVLDIKLLLRMMKFGLPTLPANLAAIILQVADRPILTELTNSYHEVVTYQINYRLGIPMMIFVTVFEYAWKPFYLSNYREENSKELFSRIFTYFTLAAAGIFIIITLFIAYIVKMPGIGGEFFINPEYWSGLHIIPIILLAYYFNGVFTNISAGLLIEKQTKYLPIAVGLAAIVNIIVNFTLIPKFGYTGAAWATLIAYLTSAVFVYVVTRKIYPVNYEWKRILKIALATAFIFYADLLFSSFLDDLIIVIIKMILLLTFLFILKYLGFFAETEKELIRRFLKRK